VVSCAAAPTTNPTINTIPRKIVISLCFIGNILISASQQYGVIMGQKPAPVNSPDALCGMQVMRLPKFPGQITDEKDRFCYTIYGSMSARRNGLSDDEMPELWPRKPGR
ncbi:MAG: hypothetical protein KC496_07165, partial [Anaerolineae bacterium]|nr:hypothetical protein [Anaerolineae bacterium]